LFLPPNPFFATEPRVRCGRNADQNDFFSEDKLMNKLIAILIAGTFALGSVAAMAQIPQGEKTPPQPVDQAKLKAERDAARAVKADEAKMTPEEKAKARKERRAKKQQEASGIAKQADTGDKAAQQQKDKADAAAAKAQPKALPDAKAKQDALKEQTKKASGQ
jgi:cytoskeletal protein RodZ